MVDCAARVKHDVSLQLPEAVPDYPARGTVMHAEALAGSMATVRSKTSGTQSHNHNFILFFCFSRDVNYVMDLIFVVICGLTVPFSKFSIRDSGRLNCFREIVEDDKAAATVSILVVRNGRVAQPSEDNGLSRATARAYRRQIGKKCGERGFARLWISQKYRRENGARDVAECRGRDDFARRKIGRREKWMAEGSPWGKYLSSYGKSGTGVKVKSATTGGRFCRPVERKLPAVLNPSQLLDQANNRVLRYAFGSGRK